MKRLLLPALFAVALSSCIGVQSQLSLGRDGSGTLRISYRVAQFLREGQGLPLPASREDFQRAVEAEPGLSRRARSRSSPRLSLSAAIAGDRTGLEKGAINAIAATAITSLTRIG